MHNTAVILENKTHNLRWDFEIQRDHLIPSQTTRPHNNRQKKETC